MYRCAKWGLRKCDESNRTWDIEVLANPMEKCPCDMEDLSTSLPLMQHHSVEVFPVHHVNQET